MKFNNHFPSSPLNRHIESTFHYSDFMPEHSVERVVPTGHLFLIFELDGIPRNTFDNETQEPRQTFTKVWISGQHTGCITISAHEQSEMFVIQFKPAGAFPFIQVPVFDLKDQIVPAEEILGMEILTLRDQLLAEETPDEKFEAGDKWLKSRFDETKQPPETMLSVLDQLQKKPVSMLSEIIEEYPNTQKHLIDQFKRYVGLTPKKYQRIVRFNEILQKIRDTEQITWAEIAYRCGYSDQSHFIKEFNHFSGFNPQEFIDREYHQDEPNFFPLDREG